jgi:hypothetical protein
VDGDRRLRVMPVTPPLPTIMTIKDVSRHCPISSEGEKLLLSQSFLL